LAKLQAAYVALELRDEHHQAFRRQPTMPQSLEDVSKMKWPRKDRRRRLKNWRRLDAARKRVGERRQTYAFRQVII
jgi:hypothetical protein